MSFLTTFLSAPYWLVSFLVLVLSFLTGCGAGVNAFPKEIGEVAKSVAVSMTEQSVWQNVVANVDGQVVEPGMEVYAGMIYVAGGKLKGVSGQVGLRGTGTGTGVPNSPDANAAIRQILLDQTLTEAAKREAILKLIGSATQPAK